MIFSPVANFGHHPLVTTGPKIYCPNIYTVWQASMVLVSHNLIILKVVTPKVASIRKVSKSPKKYIPNYILSWAWNLNLLFTVIAKSFSEALILVSTNPQYVKRFIDLQVQHMKTTSSEHVVYINCFFVLTFKTIYRSRALKSRGS